MIAMTQIGQTGDMARATRLLEARGLQQEGPVRSALSRRMRAESELLEHPEIEFTYKAMLENIKKAETPKELEVMSAQIKRMGQSGELDAARSKSLLSMLSVEKRLRAIQGDVLKVKSASDVLKMQKDFERIDQQITESKTLLPAQLEHLKDRSALLKQQAEDLQGTLGPRRRLMESQAGLADARAAAAKMKSKGIGSLSAPELRQMNTYLNTIEKQFIENPEENVNQAFLGYWNQNSTKDYIYLWKPSQGVWGENLDLQPFKLPISPRTGRRYQAWEVQQVADIGWGGDVVAYLRIITQTPMTEFTSPEVEPPNVGILDRGISP